MGKDVSNQTRPLTDEERAFASEGFARYYDDVIPQIIEELDKGAGERRFGVELEYHCVDGEGIMIPGSAARVLEGADFAVPEAVNFQIELVSDPYAVNKGPLACLEEMVDKEQRLSDALADCTGGILFPVGVLPTYRKSDGLNDLSIPRARNQIILDYVLRFMKQGPVVAATHDGIPINLGHIHTAGLINETHVSLSGISAADSVSLFNAATALAAPVVALSANSTSVSRRVTSNQDEQIFLYEQNKETNSSGIQRVGLFPKYISSLHDYIRQAMDFDPIFKFDEERKPESFLSHMSTYWPWVRLQVNGFYRVELRSVSKQPTVLEDAAVAAFYIYSALSLLEKGDTRPVNERELRTNLYRAAHGGLSADIDWHGRAPAALVCSHLLNVARQYMERHDIKDDGLLGIVEKRIADSVNPATLFREKYFSKGYDHALADYIEHTQSHRNVPFAG
ncbi:MAG: hypothetical protein KJ601_03755 [Nanoarchaeota archaeon]|nr:hypothetical protein [Nanoarchaeota archaeon]